jgi:hypothetical protein
METKIIMGEPEFIGKFPIRQDIQVLPADAKTIDKRWTILNSYCGFEIMRLSKYAQKKLSIEQQLDIRAWPRNAADTKYKYHKTITTEDGLKVGDRVVVKSCPCDYWYYYGVLLENGMIKAECGNYSSIAFSEDDRECWTTSGSFHPSIIEGKVPLRVTLNEKEI